MPNSNILYFYWLRAATKCLSAKILSLVLKPLDRLKRLHAEMSWYFRNRFYNFVSIKFWFRLFQWWFHGALHSMSSTNVSFFEFGVRRINLDWCNPKPTLVCITHLKRRTDFSKAKQNIRFEIHGFSMALSIFFSILI
jgi:hypothetical protein